MQAFQSINSCTPRLWKTLFENILLAGGTGSCVGLQARLQKELCKLVHPNISVKVWFSLSVSIALYSPFSLSSFLSYTDTFTDFEDLPIPYAHTSGIPARCQEWERFMKENCVLNYHKNFCSFHRWNKNSQMRTTFCPCYNLIFQSLNSPDKWVHECLPLVSPEEIESESLSPESIWNKINLRDIGVRQ